MTDREKILDRLAKLKRLAAAGSGATEAEVESALSRIQALKAEHGLDDEDLAAAELGVEAVDLHRSKRQLVDNLMGAIAEACGCVAILDHRETLRAVYAGPDPMPAIAAHLHDVCYRAIQRLTKEFCASAEYKRRRKPKTRAAARRAFQLGAIESLAVKLQKLGWLPRSRRDALYLAYERRSATKLSTGSGPLGDAKKLRRFESAGVAGRQAGRSVDLNAPVTGSKALALGGPAR